MERRDLIRRPLIALAAAWLSSTPANANDADVCARVESEGAVAACTRLIQGGKLEGRPLAQVHNRRCLAYNYNKPDYDRALVDCSEALRLDPNFLAALVNRCWTYSNKNELDRAFTDCEEVVRRDPKYAPGFHVRAGLWERRSNQDRALADYGEAIRLDPKYSFAYRNRCNLHGLRNEWDRALADCNEAVRLNPNSALNFSTRCWVRNRKSDPDSAIADCTKALALNLKFSVAYINRCESWLLKKDPDRAIADCDEAIRINPNTSSAFNNRCWARTDKREFDAAIADCNEAIRLNANSPFAYNNRGNAFRNRGDKVRAVADYGEAIRVDPKLSFGYVNRGMIYEGDGKLDLALADFRAVAALFPKNTVAAERVERVERKIAEAASAKATAGEKRVALLIGNGGYARVAPLANAKRDTETLSTALKRVGFSVVTLQQDVSREQFVGALQAFAREADSADWAVVYYAGHGIELSGTNYLIPVDAKLVSDRDVPFETIALEHVLLAVEGARKLRLVILDACRDNPFRQTMKRSVASRSVGRGLARVEPEGATLVAYAAKAGQVALDGTGTDNSPFALALAKHIETPGLELNFLFRKVRDDVLSTTGRQQEPFTYGSLPAEPFYFRHK